MNFKLTHYPKLDPYAAPAVRRLRANGPENRSSRSNSLPSLMLFSRRESRPNACHLRADYRVRFESWRAILGTRGIPLPLTGFELKSARRFWHRHE
jgi:hypothetical protein